MNVRFVVLLYAYMDVFMYVYLCIYVVSLSVKSPVVFQLHQFREEKKTVEGLVQAPLNESFSICTVLSYPPVRFITRGGILNMNMKSVLTQYHNDPKQ